MVVSLCQVTPSETPVYICGEGTWRCYCQKTQPLQGAGPAVGRSHSAVWDGSSLGLSWTVSAPQPSQFCSRRSSRSCCDCCTLLEFGLVSPASTGHKWEPRSCIRGATLASKWQSLPGAALKPRSSEEFHRTVTVGCGSRCCCFSNSPYSSPCLDTGPCDSHACPFWR